MMTELVPTSALCRLCQKTDNESKFICKDNLFVHIRCHLYGIKYEIYDFQNKPFSIDRSVKYVLPVVGTMSYRNLYYYYLEKKPRQCSHISKTGNNCKSKEYFYLQAEKPLCRRHYTHPIQISRENNLKLLYMAVWILSENMPEMKRRYFTLDLLTQLYLKNQYPSEFEHISLIAKIKDLLMHHSSFPAIYNSLGIAYPKL